MLLVKTQIGPSKIDGIGLFAAQFIPEGTVIWKFVPGFDLELSEDDILQFSEPAQEQALKYSYLDEKIKKYILCSDDARFFNHSKHANTGEGESEDEHGLTIAVVDIREGEEMTCDYEAFDVRYKGCMIDSAGKFCPDIMSPRAVATVQTETKDAWVGASVPAMSVAASDGCAPS